MPAGRHGHKMREFKRRVDALLEAERERRKPPPPPISEEHAALRRQIAEANKPLEPLLGARARGDYDTEGMLDKIRESPELMDAAYEVLDLQLKERDLLAEHGVDWRLYQR
jgi:hypothetical protein